MKNDSIFTVITSGGKDAYVPATRIHVTADGALVLWIRRSKVGHFRAGYWTRVYLDATEPTAPKIEKS